MTPAAVQRLRAEVAADLAAWTTRLDELEGLSIGAETGAAHLAQAAVALHHGYGALEAALARVTRALEGELPRGADWHLRVLEGAALEVPGVRPALIPRDLADGLRHLLGFRHWFRHAYAVRWDAARLGSLRETALGLRPGVSAAGERLDAWLAALAEQLERAEPRR